MKTNFPPKVISIASAAATNLELYSTMKDDEVLYISDAMLIIILSQVFRLPYKILIPPDGEYGRRLPDGNWTGLIGMVKRSEVDLAVASIALFHQRFEAVNFSYPYYISEMIFMTDKLKPLSTSLALLYPFSLMLWILLVLIILSVSFLLFVLTKKKQAFQDVLFMIFQSLFEKSMYYKVRKISFGLILITWLIFIFVITNSYKALLLSFLTFPSFTGIRNIPDLAKAAEQNLITCYTYKGNEMPEILLKSDNEPWRSIGKCLARNGIKFGEPEDFFMKAPPNKAFIGEKYYLKRYENDYFVSKDSFFNVMFALPVSKIFCCQEDLNKIIHRLFEAGLFKKHLKDEHFLFRLKLLLSNKIEKNGNKILRISDLQGAFTILICGYISASAAFFIEIAVKYYFSKRANIKIISKKQFS